jgi:hypothetical protein
MTEDDKNARSLVILTYMGGPLVMMNTLHGHKEHVSEQFIKAMANELTLNNLKFHESWDWMIPLWSKVRFKLSPSQVISAITCIDENRLEDLFILLSNIIKNL